MAVFLYSLLTTLMVLGVIGELSNEVISALYRHVQLNMGFLRFERILE